MGFWDSLKDAVGGLTAGAKGFLEGHLAEFNNGAFKDAAMAFAALITYADGEATSDEKVKVAGIIERHESLQCFDASALRSIYLKKLEDFEFDFDFAKDNIRKTMMKVTDEEQRRGIVMIGIIVGKADGDFDNDEKACVREVISMYGLALSDFPDAQ